MTKTHELAEVLTQLDDVNRAIRIYAVRHQLVERNFEGYQLLAQIRLALTQSKGIVDGFERDVLPEAVRTPKRM